MVLCHVKGDISRSQLFNRLNTFGFRLIQGGKKRRKAISEQVVLSCLSYFCRRLCMAFHIPSCKGGCGVIIDSSSF